MPGEYVANTFEYKGFTIKIIQDQDAEEPDYGENEIFLSAESHGSSYNSYRIGRRGEETGGESHLPWGEGKWSVFGSSIPEEAEEGESEAYDLYVEWKETFDPSYLVYPIRCGNAHGPGTFKIWECDDDEWEHTEGYVYIRVPVGDLERLADTRDLEKMKDGIIEMYEQWCNGDVYGYVIEDSDGEEIEDYSCWGYFGSDACEAEAKAAVDAMDGKCKDKKTLVVLKKDRTWEYRTVEVPLFVGNSHVVEWAREYLGINEEDDVQEVYQAVNQMLLFPEAREVPVEVAP